MLTKIKCIKLSIAITQNSIGCRLARDDMRMQEEVNKCRWKKFNYLCWVLV